VVLQPGFFAKTKMYGSFDPGWRYSRTAPITMDAALAGTQLMSRLVLLHEICVHMSHHLLWHDEEVRISLRSSLDFQVASELVAHNLENIVASAIPESLLYDDVSEGITDPRLRDVVIEDIAGYDASRDGQEEYLRYRIMSYIPNEEEEAAMGPLTQKLSTMARRRRAEEYVRLFLARARSGR
jgi:hypothetical protein